MDHGGGKTMTSNYDIQKIIDILPHRYPFLLIDRIIELVPDEKVLALKNVTINEPFFPGHFPGIPVMPGVLIVEAMAQAGGILFSESLAQQKQMLFYFMGMDKVRFRKPVIPGDQLIFDVKVLKMRTKAVKIAGKATVENQLVAEAELMATLGEKP
jgi:beta-hydroxyacyl-ACP dehydratase FabZ